ncbi:MAG: ImmA/IrrE family metallo-endopeptidase [Hyphomicrobiales bacterium]|nr:ImmA/IrrE family metallo-endopeptidase [Hyphomicrobiales bacterium]
MISRLDLDEKGAGSPEGLVSRILKAEPSLRVPVPVEELCGKLDISSVEYEALEGLEGALITTSERESGIILVKETSHRFRQRFTIGHELGHFLIPTHMPNSDGRFLCSRADMLLQHAEGKDRRTKMEVEANRFSSLLLIPPPLLRPRLKDDPNLNQLVKLASEFEVSKEAMARAYAFYHTELLAFVLMHSGIVRRIYKHPSFPCVAVDVGRTAPTPSGATSAGMITDVKECLPDHWIRVERGRPAPKLYEQTIGQQNNYSMVMLWLEKAKDNSDYENFDREENLTASQRLRDRIYRSSK